MPPPNLTDVSSAGKYDRATLKLYVKELAEKGGGNFVALSGIEDADEKILFNV